VEKEAAAPDSDISNSGESHVVQKPRRVILIVHFYSSLFQFGVFQLCVFVSSPIPSPHAVPYPVPTQSHTQSPRSPIPSPHAVPYPVLTQSHTQSSRIPIPESHTRSPCSPIPSPIPSPHAVPYPCTYSCHCGGFNSETVLVAVMAYVWVNAVP